MAVIQHSRISTTLRAGLRLTPEQRKAAKETLNRRAEEERARYAALTPEEMDQYDRLTRGMMPRAAF